MYILRYLILFLNPIYFIASWEVALRNPGYWWLPWLSLIMVGLSIFEFSKRSLGERFRGLVVLPMLMLISSMGLLMFLENLYLTRAIVVLVAGWLFLCLEQILNYFFFNTKYQPYAIENLYWYGGLATIFLLNATAGAAVIFLHLSVYLVGLVLALIFFLVGWQLLISQKISWGKGWWFAVLIPIITWQLFVGLNYLPLGYFVISLLLTLAAYFMWGLARLFMLERWTRHAVSQYLIIGSIILILTLITAAWY